MRRLTKWVVEAMVSTLSAKPDMCLVLSPLLYPKTGPIRVTRDGKKWTLHRYLLYRDTGVEPDPAVCLLPGGCETEGCLNPYHRIQSRRRGRPERAACPNGHPYVPSNVMRGGRYKCRACYEAYKAGRRKGLYGHGTCRKGHPIRGKNVYRWVDENGVKHRRCRRCQLDRQHAYRMRRKEQR